MKSIQRAVKRNFPKENEVHGMLKKLALEEVRLDSSVLQFLLSNGSEVNMHLKSDDKVIIISSDTSTGERGEFEDILKILLNFGNGVNSGIGSHFKSSFSRIQQNQTVLSEVTLQYFNSGRSILNELEHSKDEDDGDTFVRIGTILANLNGHGVNCEPFKDKIPLHKTMNLFETGDSIVDTTSFLFSNGAQVNSLLFGHGECSGRNKPLHDVLFRMN